MSNGVTPVLAGVGVLIALVVPACGGDGVSVAERSAVGVILQVEASSITQVDSFTLRSNDGETLVFRIAPDARPDPQEGFVASHLRSHAALAEQVEVFYREENGELLALRLVDR